MIQDRADRRQMRDGYGTCHSGRTEAVGWQKRGCATRSVKTYYFQAYRSVKTYYFQVSAQISENVLLSSKYTD